MKNERTKTTPPPDREIHAGSGKPIMPLKEATYHAAKANGDARREAKDAAADETAVEALMDKDGFTVNGITLHPLNIQTIWAMQEVGSAYLNESGEAKQIDVLDIALGALIFADPKNVWMRCRAGQKAQLEEEAFDFSAKLDFETLQTVNEFIERQFSKMKKKGSAPGKQAPAETPAAAPGSSA